MNAPQPSPDDLRSTHPRLRADRLRTALRGGQFDFAAARSQPQAWLELLEAADDPAYQVLLLEVLEPVSDARLLAQLERLRTHRSDGVRLMALRMLCDRQPDRVGELAEAHRRDGNLELRVLLATRLYAGDRHRAQQLLLEILSEEAGGLRERHALERVLGFLVEEAHAVELSEQLRSMREDFADPERYFDWALAKLNQAAK
jgi:hypothetical protein